MTTMDTGGNTGKRLPLSPEEATLTGIANSTGSEVDAVLAELFEMGFPLDAAVTAINQLGSLTREEILEFLLSSEENSVQADIKQEDASHCTPDPAGDAKPKALLPVKQEVSGYFTHPKQSLEVLVQAETPSTSASAMSGDGRSWKQVNNISDSRSRVAVETPILKMSEKGPLLQRLLEMGCRADVAEKAFEIYGRDPAYGSEDERLDVMCDYIAAVNLNEEDDDPEADSEDLETRSSHTFPDEAGIEDWFASQRDIEDPRTAAQVQTQRLRQSEHTRLKQEQNESDYTPGGYYSRDPEDDPELEERYHRDLEEQEGTALLVVKRKKLCEESSSSNSTRIRGGNRIPQVTKSLVGPVSRRIRVPHFTKMTGYGVPGSDVIPRKLPQRSLDGPPYFYFENVAFMPGDEWDTISRHLYDIEPEFVNSYHFTVCKRPRGYVHNLPVEGRFEVLPRAPRTIRELVPYSTTYWPSWDDRTTLSCICTSTATEATIKPVTKLLACMSSDKEPPVQIRRQIMDILKMYNMVWIGPGQVARPKVEELEVCMGFDRDHTRSILSTNQQIKGLGNAFQVHTVGYHLSVLKRIFPKGLNVLSLFSGIGGAEVALHRLGVKMNVAVCVEIDPTVRRVIENWWKVTNQSGRLITRYGDVNELDYDTLQKLMIEVGGFDLLIGGSPCSNLSAKNRFTRMGLGGKASIAFFEYARILKDVRAFGLQHRGSRSHV